MSDWSAIMNMKNHILTALREQFNEWEELLATISEEQRTIRQHPSKLSTKDIVAHVYSWQQMSLVRLEAAASNREPTFPKAPAGFDLDTENDVDGINAWFYETYRDQPWSTIHRNWRAGFLRLLELGDAIVERELLDSSKYPWLRGHPLAFVLVASYDHHQEHLDKLRAWFQQHGDMKTVERSDSIGTVDAIGTGR